MKTFIEKFIEILGYTITKKSNTELQYDFELEAREAISKVRNHTMVSYESLVTLYQQVRHCEVNHISGDYVECGVWKGGSCGLMALANIRYGSESRHIHMFDIFDDICEPDPSVDGEKVLKEIVELTGRERQSLSGKLQPVKGVYDSHGGCGTIEIVRNLLEGLIGYEKSHVHCYEGWFQDTIPKIAKDIQKIAILRLDGDYYASTKICLEALYEKVVPGGVVIIDDYGCYEGCRKAVDEFREKFNINQFLSHVNHDCRYWCK